MNKQQLKSLIEGINVWKRGAQRAPHKPLLLLYALARGLRSRDRFIPYIEVDEKLKQLLVDFGPTRKSYHPEYPFWRLQNDGIWDLKNAEEVKLRTGNMDAKRGDLIRNNVLGGFKKEIFDMVSSDPSAAEEIANDILEANFPASIHEDILQAVGLDLELKTKEQKKRDPYFRDRIIQAYEHQCAVCGFNVRMGHTLVALEAAHIKWHQAGGPDTEENGIALCALHHKLFDRGAFTVSPDLYIQVSDRAHGTHGFTEWLAAYHKKSLRPPQRPAYYPEPSFVAWHVREVFQGKARYGA
ncbi:MAG: HNH endonuclease [Desulfobacterales bacterium]|nr:HNH endonuclease [Desulfobacterales bacterium]